MIHTLYARNVAVRYVVMIRFAMNAVHGLRIFVECILTPQRTLHQKRVSKGNAKAKAKSPPVVDDAASNASMEFHVSVPVVILPLDPQSVDVDDNLRNLGNIQNVDNIVEIQSQPEILPPYHLRGF